MGNTRLALDAGWGSFLAALHHIGGEAAPVDAVGRISNARPPAAGLLLSQRGGQPISFPRRVRAPGVSSAPAGQRNSINVRFAPKATEMLRCRKASLCANCRLMQCSNDVGGAAYSITSSASC
jgi:hypothetical protein